MTKNVYLGSDNFARIDPDTQAIVIEGPGPRGGRTLRIPLANAEMLTQLIESAKVLRAADELSHV